MKEVIVRAEEFGVKAEMAMELTAGLTVTREERKYLIEEFEQVSKLEITEENIPIFKELRNRIVKNRTQGIEKWHRASKDVFLRGGQFVDAIRRSEILINTQMEEKLLEGEKYFENLEKKRLQELQEERLKRLLPYDEQASERDLTKFENDEFEAILKIKKEAHEAKIEAERKAEELRLQQEREAEQERIRLEEENKKIKAELAEAEKARIRQQVEMSAIQAKAYAEEKARKEQERKLEEAKSELAGKQSQVELKDDNQKLDRLIEDLEQLKGLYQFEDLRNQMLGDSVNTLIEKTITYINKNRK